MSEPERSEYQSDEIESFLRILIRQSRTFIAVLLVVSVVGLIWVWRSQPRYEVSFQYVTPDPAALVTTEGVVIYEAFDLEIFEREVTAEGKRLAKAFALDSANGPHPSWAISSVATRQGRWIRYTMNVREDLIPLALELQADLVESIEKKLDARRVGMESVVTKYIAYLPDEIDRLMVLLKDGLSVEEAGPMTALITNQLGGLAEELVSLRMRADEDYRGKVLVQPSQSDTPVSISHLFKLAIVGFVAIMASVFLSLLMEYWQRARRPIS